MTVTVLLMSILTGQNHTVVAEYDTMRKGLSALPQKRTCAAQLAMSAKGQKRTCFSWYSVGGFTGGASYKHLCYHVGQSDLSIR